MSRTFRSISMAAIATIALAVGAAAAPPPAQAKAAPAKASKATMGSHSLSGTLEKVDGTTLTLKTSSGTETVMVGSDARILQGRRSLAAADLSSQTGSRVRVSYDESNGHKTAHEIHLSGGMKGAKKTK